jgi:hypothetical protein
VIASMSRRTLLTDEALVPLLLFIGLGAFVWLTPAQNDTWWHLRSGQEMWATGSLLTTERFSHTAFGAAFSNYWWLSQLAFYALFTLGGPVLLTLFAGSCAFAAVYGSWRLMRGAWEARLTLLLFLTIATAPQWAVRPQVISLAFIVLSAYLIVNNRSGWLPLLCVVWANTHPQVVFGVLIAGAAALEALVWSRTRARRDVLVAAGCVAALLASPDGWHYWSETVNTVSISRAVELQEYRPPVDAGSIPLWLAVATLLVMTWTKRSTLRDWARGDRVLLITSFLLALASLGAVRNTAFFAVIAAPVLSRLCSGREPAQYRPRPVGRLAYGMVAVAILIAVLSVRARWDKHGEQLGWQPLSASLIEAVRKCPDRLFNHLVDGGPLMWALPSRHVFVDSRMNAYPITLLKQSREADLRGEYADLFRQYGIRCAVVATDSPLARRLELDDAMTRTYSDPQRTVFARSSDRHSPASSRVNSASAQNFTDRVFSQHGF